ncbi:MAG: hypothetical protein KDA22_03225 [Phycisphaerales bacterium]|nr:hypothetical protein [Phycisphaerales bacterium]
MKVHAVRWVAAAAALSVFAACDRRTPVVDHAPHDEPAPSATNRIDIPPAVRSNLGITFAAVEQRPVATTIRAPGRFELLPTARREQRAPLPGRVELLVAQYDRVEPGTPLYRLDAPQWRDMQREIEATMSADGLAQARLAALDPLLEAHRVHESACLESVRLWESRVEQLEKAVSAGGGRASELATAQASLATARSALGEVQEKDAELALRRSEVESDLRAARSKLDLLLSSAAATLGVNRSAIEARSPADGEPLWKRTGAIEIHSTATGVVEAFGATSGAWIEQGELVLSVVDPTAVRFRAVGLQSDLGRLSPGLAAAIVPPQGGALDIGDSIPTTLEIGLGADPQQRTVELLAVPSRLSTWTRPGVSAFLEITIDAAAETELAIPLSCVVRDGLQPVLFRRDPHDPNKAIRIEADLGIDDGRWIVIHSGVRAGDQIVLDGAYQLLLATSGTIQKGGHFHSDGTFHEGEDH